MRLLLISATQSPYFEHCKEHLANFLASSKLIGFVSAARLTGEQEYFREVEERLIRHQPMIAKEVLQIPWDSTGIDALRRVDAVIVGGGNCYALLKRLKEAALLEPLRARVLDGLPYVGSSAGAIIAGPNLLTTNDWNVVALRDFQSLRLTPFNINPHYAQHEASDAPYSAPRDVRIREYVQQWRNPVLALQDSAILEVSDHRTRVLGSGRVKAFFPDYTYRWFSAGDDVAYEDATGPSR